VEDYLKKDYADWCIAAYYGFQGIRDLTATCEGDTVFNRLQRLNDAVKTAVMWTLIGIRDHEDSNKQYEIIACELELNGSDIDSKAVKKVIEWLEALPEPPDNSA